MPVTDNASPDASIPLIVGFLFLIGLVADLVGRHTFLPRVTLLLLGGLAVGPSSLGLVPEEFVQDWFPPLTNIALGMIGFLLGEKLTLESIRRRGFLVLGFSIGKALGAAAFVVAGLALAGVELPVALLLGGIATATAPAATYDVVEETGASGELSDTLLGVVALDDAWGLFLFTLLMVTAGALLGQGELDDGVVAGVGEIAGSLLLGAGLGVPMAYLTGRVRAGEPTLAEALGLVMLATGLAIWLGLSPILTAMAMGSAVANLARHHVRPFHAIKGIEWPFFIVFFVLAGASLELERLAEIGSVGAVYIAARTAGTYVGARLGGRLAGAPPLLCRWLGLALLPQAGVAIGMTLLASQRFPDQAELLLSVVLSSTVVFEVFAPVVTRKVLGIAGE
jgi:Kef-type K+ transport system membrane component KefB